MDYIELLPYIPLSLIIVIPTLFGVYQLIFTSLRSPIHFQQGIHDTTSWRSALCGSLLAISPFVCVLPLSSTSSLLLYPIGYIMALLYAAFVVSPTLHYIPSPSICQYMHLRFHLPILRMGVVLIHVVLITSLSIMLLVYSTSLLAEVSSLSPLIICPIIAYLSIFSVLCGGQTTVSAPTFFIPFIVIIIGIGVLTYKGIGELWSIFESADLLESISSAPMWIAFSLGVLNGLHLVIASPLIYQQYFSLSTRQRLRNSLILHVLFFTLFSFSLLSTSSLYTSFLASVCPPSASFPSIVAFLGTVLPSKQIVTNFLAASCVLITMVSLSFTLLSLATLIWEDLIRPKFARCSQIRQLYIVQLGLIGAGTVVTTCSLLLIHYGDDFLAYAPFIFVSLSVLASPVTALFFCSFMFPCTNSKGAVGGLLIGYLAVGILSLVHFRASVLLFPMSPCLNATSAITTFRNPTSIYVDNSTLASILLTSTSAIYEQQPSTFIHFFQTVPFSAFPLVAFIICCLSTIGISLCSGGEDMVALDWNLIACASLAHVLLHHGTITARSRRAFIESESFRYAQQTPYPDTKYLSMKVGSSHERQKLT